ncbi:hypothetical protein TWF694_005313 [Orbilia ellipsospora]|uniref:Uncharacterized protein n=1 Tax=Orbilia ellipsospora TaxID=2528407 RepID=A0AAV9WU28_9PEZI
MKFSKIISVAAVLVAGAHAIPQALYVRDTVPTMTGTQAKNAFLTGLDNDILPSNKTKALKDAPESFWNGFADLVNKARQMPQNSTERGLKILLGDASMKLLNGEIPDLSSKEALKKRKPLTPAEFKRDTIKIYFPKLLITDKLDFFKGLKMDVWSKLADLENKFMDSVDMNNGKLNKNLMAQAQKARDTLFTGQIPDFEHLASNSTMPKF